MSTEPRFIAEWISAQHQDEYGEWMPDDDELTISEHLDLASAQRAALAGSKEANVTEWCKVTEVHFNAELGIPARSGAAWDAIRSWHGDWEGNWDES